MIQDLVISELKDRRLEQDKKWGSKRTIDYQKVPRILGEEYGEVCRALNEENPASFKDELKDCAAFCMATLEQIIKEEYGKKEDPFSVD